MTDPNGQPVPLLWAHNEQPRLLDPQISVSKSDLEPSNVDRAAADDGAPTSLPPSSLPPREYVVEMQPISHDPNIDVTDPSGQPVPLPAAHNEQPRLLDPQSSISKSTQEQNNVDRAAADGGAPTSLPPSSIPLGECVVEIQPISHDPNTDPTDPSGQPVPLPAASDQRPRLSNPCGSVSGSVDNGLLTQSPGWSQHLSIWPLKLCCCGRKFKTHPSST